MKVVNRLAELVAQKERREGRRITNAVISQETGLSINTVSAWINNKAGGYRTDTLLTLCKWVPCDVGDLVVIEDAAETNRNRQQSDPAFEAVAM